MQTLRTMIPGSKRKKETAKCLEPNVQKGHSLGVVKQGGVGTFDLVLLTGFRSKLYSSLKGEI